MVLQAPFPPDIRVENEAASLLAEGHGVHLLCSEDLRSTAGVPTGLEDLNVYSVPRTWEALPTWKRRIRNIPLLWFLNLHWANEIVRANHEHGPFDVIHVHDLPLLRTAKWAARHTRSRIVADLHENYPMVLPYYLEGRSFTTLQRFRRSPRRWRRYERRSVPSCAGVIAVVDEMKERLVSIGVPGEKIAVVQNFVPVDRFLSYPVDDAVRDRFRDRFVITYAGVFTGTRELDVVVDAMKTIIKDLPDSLLLLVGDGPPRSALEQLSTKLGLREHVQFEGRVPFDRVPSYLAASDVCILPLVKSVQTDAGLAHKLFQYMLMGKPVVAGNCVATKRVLDDAGCGLVYRPSDAGSLATAILELKDPVRRAELGENGRRAVLNRYNWSAASEGLLDLYRSLETQSGLRALAG